MVPFFATQPGGEGGRFPETRHSAIIALRSTNDAERERARDQIARVYWRPVYKYIRIKWNRESDDARDLMQGFFLQVFEKNFCDDYNPGRARFRTFLRTCLDRFVQREDAASSRLKRGGEALLVPLDIESIEAEMGDGSAPTTDSADDIFDREWLQGLLSHAVSELEIYCRSQDRGLAFALFDLYDLATIDDSNRPSYADLAVSFQITTETVTNNLAYARREFRRITLETLRAMTASDEEFREEARSVLGINI